MKERPKTCPYCGALRVERPDFQWQYNCKDVRACIKKWDKESSECLQKKYL